MNAGISFAPRSGASALSSEPAAKGLWLGLDTGGTFTDAVLLAEGRRVVASAKALTTPWDLAIGIGSCDARGARRRCPRARAAHDISLVSVSTTLATNAVVENRFSPVCTLRDRLRRCHGRALGLGARRRRLVVRIRGRPRCHRRGVGAARRGRGASARCASMSARVEAFAVAANFSVRNPAHELRARAAHPRALARSR